MADRNWTLPDKFLIGYLQWLLRLCHFFSALTPPQKKRIIKDINVLEKGKKRERKIPKTCLVLHLCLSATDTYL